jgi:hypothetical protein
MKSFILVNGNYRFVRNTYRQYLEGITAFLGIETILRSC